MYDAVNRLSNATFFGGCEQYTYDNWGNLTAEQPFGTCTGVMWNMPADGNNRIMAYQSNYDASGNLTYITGLSGASTFNAENQLASFSGNMLASFAYDGDGRRVKASETWVNPQTTWYWNDLSGDVLVETDQLLNIRNLYFYLNGERIGYAPQGGAGNIVYFYYRDQLGNVRAITDQNGTQCFAADYDPWGGIIPGNYQINNCPTEYNRFTGKDRDPIMGVDYFGARYYKNDMGRFYSPDDGEDQNPLNPQSWNLYTYVRNNPSTLTDEDGRSVTICDANGHCSTVSNDDYSQAQQQDKYNNAPSLSSLQSQYGMTGSATGNVTDSGGNVVGTVQYVPDNPGLEGPANLAGARELAAIGIGVDNFISRALSHPAVQGFLSVFLFAGGGEEEGALEGVGTLEAAADAERIANGHAFLKHAGEFGNISKDEFKELVQATISNPSDARSLANGRTAYWNEGEHMVVIRNPNSADGGTAFRPAAGKAYFDNLR